MRRLTLLFLSFMLLLSGCMPYVRQPPEAETTRITVGFSQVGAESDWRVANTESMRESLSEENGLELLFDNARQEQENQFKAIRTFIQQDVDYIVLAPVTETGWESVLEEARTAGIPVIIVDRQIKTDDDSLYTSWVGSDFRRTADEAVSWLAETLEARESEDAEVQILHLQGTPGSTAQLQRSAALEAGAASHEGWMITAQLNGDFTQAKAYEETLAYLQSNPAPDVVYCENDNMCFGVMQALDELGIAYGTGGVTLISFDAVRRALSYCKDGKSISAPSAIPSTARACARSLSSSNAAKRRKSSPTSRNSSSQLTASQTNCWKAVYIKSQRASEARMHAGFLFCYPLCRAYSVHGRRTLRQGWRRIWLRRFSAAAWPMACGSCPAEVMLTGPKVL